MTEADLTREVARATGETVSTIRDMGFGLADPVVVCHDPEPIDVEERIVDWDDLARQRVAPDPRPNRRALAIA